MGVLETIHKHVAAHPNRIVHQWREHIMTYETMWKKSEALGAYLKKRINDKNPILVYGNKQNGMLISFLACVKSGHAYIPVDVSVPVDRVKEIIDVANVKCIIALDELELDCSCVLCSSELDKIYNDYIHCVLPKESYVKPQDDFYIIFTSGSTGKPKGVRITYQCLSEFLSWSSVELDISEDKIFINQAPFSFDLSVMDLYLSLTNAGSLYSIDKKMLENPMELFHEINNSKLNVWVSTPSFMEFCLFDKSFSEMNFPSIEKFLFCGELLSNKSVQKLQERFPHASIYNTYGPTEATVAVTSVLVTKEICEKYNPLPVGKPAKVVHIDINDADEAGQGEIIIKGNCVSVGYLNDEVKTEQKFFAVEGGKRAYRTGDKGYYKDGYLFYLGRVDTQIKFNGYRIEIEEIENRLVSIENINKAVVVPKINNNGKVVSLIAYILFNKNQVMDISSVKVYLEKSLPAYMIPKKINIVDDIPMNVNGKVDRKYFNEVPQ